jgi:rod shape-determining protein MreC
MQYVGKSIRAVLQGGLLIAVLAILYRFGAMIWVEQALSVVVMPVQAQLYALVTTMSPLHSTNDAALLTENTQLKIELEKLVQDNNRLSEEVSNFNDYQQAFNFTQERSLNLIPAKFISRVSKENSIDLLTINQGTAAGVQEGYPVIYGQGTVLGVVYHATETHAEVAPITSNLIRIRAMVQNDTKTEGIISGAFGTGLTMGYILKDKPIAVGDIIVTNQQDAIPAGLIIGSVESVTDESSELFKSAAVRPLWRYDHNALIAVVRP